MNSPAMRDEKEAGTLQADNLKEFDLLLEKIDNIESNEQTVETNSNEPVIITVNTASTQDELTNRGEAYQEKKGSARYLSVQKKRINNDLQNGCLPRMKSLPSFQRIDKIAEKAIRNRR